MRLSSTLVGTFLIPSVTHVLRTYISGFEWPDVEFYTGSTSTAREPITLCTLMVLPPFDDLNRLLMTRIHPPEQSPRTCQSWDGDPSIPRLGYGNPSHPGLRLLHIPPDIPFFAPSPASARTRCKSTSRAHTLRRSYTEGEAVTHTLFVLGEIGRTHRSRVLPIFICTFFQRRKHTCVPKTQPNGQIASKTTTPPPPIFRAYISKTRVGLFC